MIDEIQESFRDQTVLITGHTGFKGSWLSIWLKRLGATVVGYSLAPPSSPSNFEVSGVADLIDEDVIGDIRDFRSIRSVVERTRPRYVFHMAAQTVVKTGYQEPRETFDINVTGTASVLDAVAKYHGRCTVICVTSDKCYANEDSARSFVESDPMGERDPYGASKGCTELVAKAYMHSFFSIQSYHKHQKTLATARAGNVIAGGDWTPHALVPDLVEAANANTWIRLRYPNATRPWQHVLQTLSGYLLLASRLDRDPERYSSGWNFGPAEDASIRVADFADLFFEHWGQGQWQSDEAARVVKEAETLSLSIEKARRELQWAPVWDTHETVRQCVEWYKRFQGGEKPLALCRHQIAEFESSCRLHTV